MDSKLILDPNEVAAFVTPEETLNYVRDKIEQVRLHTATKPPPPTNDLTSTHYMTWHNKSLILYGRAVGTLCAAQAFRRITVEEFQALKKRLIAALVRREADFQLGGV